MTAVATDGYYEGLVDFNNYSFSFGKDCIGAEIPFEYRGLKLHLCFPRFDFDKCDGFGSPTINYAGTNVEMGHIEVRHSPHNGASLGAVKKRSNTEVLKFSCNMIVVRSQNKVSPRNARRIMQLLPEWQQKFIKWFEVCEFKDFEHEETELTEQEYVESFYLRNGQSRKIRTGAQDTSILFRISTPMSTANLRKALDICATGDTPPAYYIMLINALKHLHQHHYRQCMLDTATAFEIGLTELLERQLSGLADPQKKLIFDKYRMIMGLHGALTKLSVSLPTRAEVQVKIAEPRNAAIHRGSDITGQQAQDALDFVKPFLYDRFAF